MARVEPATQASTESPSRMRDFDGSLISRWRFTQPSTVTSRWVSSATMKSSAEYSVSSSGTSMTVRRFASLDLPC